MAPTWTEASTAAAPNAVHEPGCVVPGDPFRAPNCPEWTILQYATAQIGAILVTINPAYRTHEHWLPLSRFKADLLTTRRL